MSGRRFVQEAFVVSVVALQVGLLAPWFGAGRGAMDGLLVQGAFGAAYAAAAVFLFLRVVRRRRVRSTWWLMWPIAYLGLALTSMLWSDIPMLTLRRSVALAGTIVFALWVSETMEPRRLFRSVTIGLLVVAAASFAALAWAPQVAVHGASSSHAGNWRGALLHKNLLGREMALATTLALALAVSSPQPRRLRWIGAALLTATLVVGARSATGVALMASGAFIVGLAALPAATAWERIGRRGVASAAVAAAAISVFVGGPALLRWLGRDTTFTGRDRIWEVTVDLLRDHAWTGYGYGAFWEGSGGAEVSRQLGYSVGHAHNGLLQAATSLGLPGVALMIVLFAGVAWRGIRAPGLRAVRLPLVAFLLHVALLSVTDAVMSGPNSLALTVVLALALMRAPSSSSATAGAPLAGGATAPAATTRSALDETGSGRLPILDEATR
jgi:exopolysaccharide production protein ExoQ